MANQALTPVFLSAGLIILIGTTIGLTRFYLAFKGTSYDDILPGQPHGPKWYRSLNRVYINTIEAFALFAPAFLLHYFSSDPTPLLGTLCWVFLLGRLVYTLIYVGMGYKIWCSFAWLVGFGATLVLWLLTVM